MEGWIKIHRKMLENPIVCRDNETLSIWIYLLLNATHKEIPALFKGKKIMLQKGQLITGILSISKKLKINKDKVQRTLKCFEIDKQIEQQTSNQNRLITILNWNEYQDNDKQNDKQMINKCETVDKQMITNKNVKNVNNVKNIYKDFPEDFKKALDGFVEMRNKIKKPLTERGIQLALTKLNSLSKDKNTQIEIINNSVMNSWQSFYPLKQATNTFTNKQTNFNNYQKRNYKNLNKLYANGGENI